MSKIFGIGMFKTGTKSLGTALNTLGFNTHPWCWNVLQDSWGENRERWGESLEEIFEFADKYDAFCDAPWIFLYKELDQQFPDSKFILTTRPHLDVAQSEMNMWSRNGAAEEEIPSPDKFIKRISTHEKEVMEYFEGKRDSLLTIDFSKGEGWKELCSFLEVEEPEGDLVFPHTNRGS